MLMRFFRSRRRPPYGSCLCFAISSLLLLLLSVSFLYSLLSRSLPHPHILHNPFHEDEDASASGEIDDTIDEIEVIDEDQHQQQKEPADLGGEFAGSDSRIKDSGYFFDHVSGCIRRRFKKRAIEEWDDDDGGGGGFLEGSGMEEDRSKAAFASDDTPVDEEVRRKAAQVMGVEDALLLNLGRRDSSLRKGWGDWFGKKGESRETRDSDLQENDDEAVNYNASAWKCKTNSNRKSRSETKVTERRTLNDNERNEADNVLAFKSDGESRSEIRGAEHRNLNENLGNGYRDDVGTQKKLSDDVHKVLDESVGDGSTEKDMNSGTRKYVGSEEHARGTRLDNIADHVGKLDRSSGSEDVATEIQRRPEFLNHIYADGERWGYYPGLPPNLTFTEFIDAFFRMGKCYMRVFMVWNSPPWMYGVRHQRGLESLLYHHRDACVVVFSETIELDFFKDNFVNDGYKVAVAMPNLDELLKDTPTHIFASIWFEWRKINFYSTHYSELIRLAALYKYGGIYLDSDIIVLKPISSLNNSVGMEDHIAGSSLNGAVMAFRKHSLFIKECLNEFYLTYDDTSLRGNGADLLTRVARNFLKDKNKYVKQMELEEERSYIFFPISSQKITRYFMAPTSKIEKALQDTLFKKILRKSLTFHFWNSLTSALVPEPESLVTRLINYRCIRCLELL